MHTGIIFVYKVCAFLPAIGLADHVPARPFDKQAVMSLDDVARKYAVSVSPTLLTLIDPADPRDPIARQFLPSLEELRDPAGRTRRSHRRRGAFAGARHRASPSRPRAVQGGVVLPGLLPLLFPPRNHRARARPTPCRRSDLDARLGLYRRAIREIWEVILTGGDPFILSPRRAGEITRRLAAIAHVKIVRWHTRVPMVDPARVTR